MNNLTLGEILAKRQEEERQDDMLKLERLARQGGEAEQEKLKKVVDFFEEIKNNITENIINGVDLKPITIGHPDEKHKLIGSLLSSASMDVSNKNHLYNPVWKKFCKWAEGQKLQIEFRYAHDGGGMWSWHEIRVAPKLELVTHKRSGIKL